MPFSSQKSLSLGWHILQLTCVFVTLVILPVTEIVDTLSHFWLLTCDLVICGLFAADQIYLKRLGKDFSSLKPSRLSGLISIVPLHAMAAIFATKASPIFLALHLLRIPSLVKRLRWHGENTIIGKGFHALAIISLSTLVFHWLACFWMYLQPPSQLDLLTQYNQSLYWAITTLTTVGYGDITPTDNITRAFTMMVMLLGVLFYGLVIGQISQYMLAADKRKQSEKEELESLTALLKHYGVPTQLQNETYRFYRHHLQKSEIEDEARILAALPSKLESQIRIHMKVKPLSKVALFQSCSMDCLADVASALEHEYFAPGEQVIRKGELGQEMYMIGHGEVSVHLGNEPLVALSDGACFGEMALLAAETRNADVTARSYCDLYKLSKNAFDSLVEKHPELQKSAHSLAASRQAS